MEKTVSGQLNCSAYFNLIFYLSVTCNMSALKWLPSLFSKTLLRICCTYLLVLIDFPSSKRCRRKANAKFELFVGIFFLL